MKTLQKRCEHALTRPGVHDSAWISAAAGRLDAELDLLEQDDHIPLMTTLAELTDFARRNGIGVGPGRGSVGGCLVAFLTGVTDINPLSHGLAFEPFLQLLKKPATVVQMEVETSGCEAVRQFIETAGRPSSNSIRALPSPDLDLLLAVIRHVWPIQPANESVSRIPLDDKDVMEWVEQLLPDGRFVSTSPVAKKLRRTGFQVRSFPDVVTLMRLLHFPDNHASVQATASTAHLTGLALTTYRLTFMKMHYSMEFETCRRHPKNAGHPASLNKKITEVQI